MYPLNESPNHAIAGLLGRLAVACVLLTLVSCIYEDGPSAPISGSGDVWLTFDIAGSESTQRRARSIQADEDKDSHPAEDATAAENEVNPADVVLIMLDDNRNVWRVMDRSDYVVIAIGGNDGDIYRVSARVNMSYFDYWPGEAIPASFLMIANSEGTGGSNFSSGSLTGVSASELSRRHYSYAFTSPNGSWRPSSSAGSYVPMAGLKHYILSRTALESSTAATPYEIGQGEALYLQRAMTKIRIVDDINPEYNTHISGFSITGLSQRGALMPDFETTRQQIGSQQIDWAEGTEQVELPTAETGWYSSKATATGSYEASETSYDGTVTGTWTAYLPEYDSAAGEAILTITTRDTATGEEQQWSYPLPSELGLRYLVRNHIYEFKVRYTPSGEPVLRYTVCPWVDSEIDIPTFE